MFSPQTDRVNIVATVVRVRNHNPKLLWGTVGAYAQKTLAELKDSLRLNLFIRRGLPSFLIKLKNIDFLS